MNPTEFQAAVLDFFNKVAQSSNATSDADELLNLAEQLYLDLNTALLAAGETPSVPGPRVRA